MENIPPKIRMWAESLKLLVCGRPVLPGGKSLDEL